MRINVILLFEPKRFSLKSGQAERKRTHITRRHEKKRSEVQTEEIDWEMNEEKFDCH